MSHNLIPPMEWELQAASAAGLSQSELRFAISFMLYVAVGLAFRYVPTTKGRYWYALITGLALIYYPFGTSVLHALVPSTLIYLAMRAVPSHCGTLAWLIAFPYLIFNHVSQASGLAWKAGQLDFTGAQMVLTLKLIAIGMCVQDGAKRDTKMADKPYRSAMKLDRVPSLLEFYSYCFACGNLLAGPFFEAKEYFDFVDRKGDWDASKHGRLPTSFLPGMVRFGKGLLCAGLWMTLGRRYNAGLLESPWWQTISVPRRLVLVWVVGLAARLKYYFVWAVAEAGLVLSGQCFSGQDQKGHPRWQRYINTRVRSVEFQESLAALPASWNICTGKFLRHYVYDRLTPPGRKPTVMTLLGTQLVSGVWHGLFPGYWAFFATSAIFLQASKVIYRYEQSWPAWIQKFLPWRVLKMVFTAFILNYSAMSFLVLTWNDTWQVWKSMNFIGHFLIAGILLVGAVLPPRRRRRQGAAVAGDKPDAHGAAPEPIATAAAKKDS